MHQFRFSYLAHPQISHMPHNLPTPLVLTKLAVEINQSSRLETKSTNSEEANTTATKV